MSAALLTVQTCTSLPAAWASATNSGSERSSAIPGPTAVALPVSSSRRTGAQALADQLHGRACRAPGRAIRRTASCEKLIIRTAGFPAHSTGRPVPEQPEAAQGVDERLLDLPGVPGRVLGLDREPHRAGAGGRRTPAAGPG